MLIDKYLPEYHFNKYHSIVVNGSVDDSYQKMLQCNFSKSVLIKLLFRVRGITDEVCSVEDLVSMGFTKLGEEPGREILFGMVTVKPTFNTCRDGITPAAFLAADALVIKAVINFSLQDEGNFQKLISTETRVWCGSAKLRSQFKHYWFFIKPFSQLIRKSMLKRMKQHIISSHNLRS